MAIVAGTSQGVFQTLEREKRFLWLATTSNMRWVRVDSCCNELSAFEAGFPCLRRRVRRDMVSIHPYPFHLFRTEHPMNIALNRVFRRRNVLIGIAALFVFSGPVQAGPLPRLAVLTDIGGDPDDMQSMVRLMVYANQFEIEALIASASGTRGELKESVTRTDLILQVVDAYGAVRPNLERHETGWPEASSLRDVIVSGNRFRGRDYIGDGHDTDGSRLLIERVDAGTEDRPLNIAIWGGQTDLAQALWRVTHDRGPEGLASFVKKFRVYDINDQDGIADWMQTTFPDMCYVLAKAPEGQDKRLGTYRGMYLTGNTSTTIAEWIEANVRSHGPLGQLYPTKTWTAPNPYGCLKEGDTPSWFFFLASGGNNPDNPSQPGWGGRFERSEDGFYRDLPATEGFDPRTTVSRWRDEFQADFAERMSWCD